MDTITGGEGADLLTGGAGADLFIFDANDSFAATAVANRTATFGDGVDVITDFNATQGDVFQLNGFDQPNIGASVSINNGLVQLNPNADQIPGGTRTFFISGTWNQATNTFTDVSGGGINPSYLIFQAVVPTINAGDTFDFNPFIQEAIILQSPVLV
jgi:Ca2+-binding RTX toxin-like protein